MNIITWNVKGLGILKKTSSIKEVFKKYKADLIMIQETTKFSIDKISIQSWWRGRNKDWVYSPSEGAARGMLIAWKSDLYILLAVENGLYTLSVRLWNAALVFLGGYLVFMCLHLTEEKKNFGHI